MPLDSLDRQELAISDLLDRALNKGVVIWGEATISLAGVDLIYVGVKVLVGSVDAVQRMRKTVQEPLSTGVEGPA